MRRRNTADSKILRIVATKSITAVKSTDVLVVTGGPGIRDLRERQPLIDWIRAVHLTTQWTTSVCTGSILLGLAGLLESVQATTHWAYIDSLGGFGATAVNERFVRAGKIITAAGVSAGIDMALWLAGEIAGDDIAQQIQLTLEYDPQPPFDSSSPAKATPLVRAAVTRKLGDS